MLSSSLLLTANQYNKNIRIKGNNIMHGSRLEAKVYAFGTVKSLLAFVR